VQLLIFRAGHTIKSIYNRIPACRGQVPYAGTLTKSYSIPFSCLFPCPMSLSCATKSQQISAGSAPRAEEKHAQRHHSDTAQFLAKASKDVYGTTAGGSLEDRVGRRKFYSERKE
jgi:hypothetical protein